MRRTIAYYRSEDGTVFAVYDGRVKAMVRGRVVPARQAESFVRECMEKNMKLSIESKNAFRDAFGLKPLRTR